MTKLRMLSKSQIREILNPRLPPSKKVELTCKGCNIKFQVTELLANQGRKYCRRECYLL